MAQDQGLEAADVLGPRAGVDSRTSHLPDYWPRLAGRPISTINQGPDPDIAAPAMIAKTMDTEAALDALEAQRNGAIVSPPI
jgi:hypothetical protein